MLDRSLMGRGLPQKYGTQAMYYLTGTPDEVRLIWPLEDPESVNALREEAGFGSSVEAYALDILEGVPFKEYTLEEVSALAERQKQLNTKS